MPSDQIPAEALTAAISAYNKSYLTSNSSNPRFVEKVVTAVLEAAAPLIAAQAAAAEREENLRLRMVLNEHDHASLLDGPEVVPADTDDPDRHPYNPSQPETRSDHLDATQAPPCTRYRVPVSDQFLEQAGYWNPVDGFRLISVDGPWLGHPAVTICTFEDDHAPAEFEGKLVEPVFQRTSSGTGIISRQVIEGQP